MRVSAVLGVLVTWCALLRGSSCADFELNLVHINDFHARFEPVNEGTGACAPGENEQGLCYGGVARLVTALRDLKETLVNPLVLNGGDNFQGTLLYSLFKWNITVDFMNRLPVDVTALGNHEFDDGVEGAVPYMEGLISPLVAANMDATKEPSVQNNFQPSVIVNVGGTDVGVIGCISKYTSEMSSSGKLEFLDEVEPVAAEAASLRSRGVNVIILLSHSGYDVDQIMAQSVPDLDIIVGAHSHSFLYSGAWRRTTVQRGTYSGEYPTLVTQESGRLVLVVQAYCHSKYVGVLNVRFDEQGEVTEWSGNPQLMDNSVAEDMETKNALEPWVREANEIGDKPLGSSLVLLDNSDCYSKECNLGSFLADGMVAEQMDKVEDDEFWTLAAIAMINPGGIRAALGHTTEITYNDLVTSQPFANSIDTIELQGKDILELMEMAAAPVVRRSFRDFTDGRGCFQVSGMQVTYNMSAPAYSRVTELLLRCARCRVPELRPVNLQMWYTVAMPSFLSAGQDGFTLISSRGRNKIVGEKDVDVFTRFIGKETPIMQGVEGRITVIV